MSSEFLNMGKVIVAYKLVVFRIKETYFLMQLILVYFSTFFFIPSCKDLYTDLTSSEIVSV